ncbi:hypothetical protein F5884DRAFT_860767 [Xylogone sp. PMI_703]|nr:hypothetical protein F5884DRAFT_860767 [Xylogone sp. PMI_703]
MRTFIVSVSLALVTSVAAQASIPVKIFFNQDCGPEGSTSLDGNISEGQCAITPFEFTQALQLQAGAEVPAELLSNDSQACTIWLAVQAGDQPSADCHDLALTTTNEFASGNCFPISTGNANNGVYGYQVECVPK